MDDNFKEVFNDWSLKGLLIGLGIGFVSEVFAIRNCRGNVRWLVTIASILSMGIMGWLTFDVAKQTFALSPWKSIAWTAGITANTWIMMKLVFSGKIAKMIATILLPEKLQKILGETDGKE
ncbi:MAG: hypothetical protein GY820_39285 [Gammaproteobacteria bacterium]|nr:hypothetical protein [Gammaproteobacteria bacterium]